MRGDYPNLKAWGGREWWLYSPHTNEVPQKIKKKIKIFNLDHSI